MDIISREDARAAGLKRYFTGAACVNGHVEERSVKSCECCQCAREKVRRHRSRPGVKDKRAEYARRPEVVARHKAYRDRPRVRAQYKLTRRAWERRPEVRERRLAVDREQARRERGVIGSRLWRYGMFHRAKVRAIECGVEFDVKAVLDLLKNPPTHCPALDIELRIGRGVMNDASPSLDRIRPELGYVRGNIAILSVLANRIKNSATAEQVITVGRWMQSVCAEPNKAPAFA